MARYAWLLALSSGCARNVRTPPRAPDGRVPAANSMNLVERARIVPIAAHHQHMVAPAFLSVWHPGPMKGATLPPALDSLMRAHRALIGVPVVTADSARSVYAADARLVLFTGVVSGPPAIARHWRSYRNEGWTRHVLPTGYTLRDSSGHIFGVMVETRPDSSTRYARRLMNVLVTVAKGTDGRWRIVAETGTPIENSVNVDTITAASLVAHLDEAGITHGVVAGLGYEFADGPETPGERERLQAENDWTVKQVAQFPGRLTVFCGMNPIRSYAIAEMDRCSKMPSVRGMKLYIHNRVDLTNPDHVQKLRAYVRAANERRLPLLVHLSIDVNDGARHARTFLEEVVPEAPDIPIQIAHMGSGGTYRLTAPDQALKVFADAAAARSPLMKNLYFDFTGSIYGTQTAASLDTLAHRMRTIGLTRILFGSDLPLFPLEPPGPAWARFRRLIPLTNDELRIIARNVMPYAR